MTIKENDIDTIGAVIADDTFHSEIPRIRTIMSSIAIQMKFTPNEIYLLQQQRPMNLKIWMLVRMMLAIIS